MNPNQPIVVFKWFENIWIRLNNYFASHNSWNFIVENISAKVDPSGRPV